MIMDFTSESNVFVETSMTYKVQIGIYAEGVSQKPAWYLIRIPESLPNRVVREDIDHFTFESTTAPEGAS